MGAFGDSRREGAPPSTWSGARVARAMTYVLPTASVLIAALVFMGPGALRPAVAARVRGAPAEGGRALAVRVEVVRAAYDIVDSGGEQELLVEASAPGQTLRAWHGVTGQDGIAEALLEASAPLRGPVALAVAALAPKQRVLAAGEVAIRRPPQPVLGVARVSGTTRGDLEIHVETTRGAVASPFVEVVRVRVAGKALGSDPLAGAELSLAGAGIDVAPAKATTDAHGVATFTVRALAHQVELSVTAHAGAATATWEGTLPVIPGAIWLGPTTTAGPRALLSPAPKEHAYVSFWTEQGRVGGAVVPLARDAQGFFSGELTVPEAPGARILYASVAGDPVEQGAGTVAWPIRPAEGLVVPPPLALLLDGLPAAQEREKQRAWTSRRTGLLLIGATALAEVLLLLQLSRAQQRQLEAHIDLASDAMPEADRAKLLGATRESPALRALLAAALVGLGFALVAALATFR